MMETMGISVAIAVNLKQRQNNRIYNSKEKAIVQAIPTDNNRLDVQIDVENPRGKSYGFSF